MRVLDDVNTWSLIRPGHESSARSAQLIRRWGLLRHWWVILTIVLVNHRVEKRYSSTSVTESSIRGIFLVFKPWMYEVNWGSVTHRWSRWFHLFQNVTSLYNSNLMSCTTHYPLVDIGPYNFSTALLTFFSNAEFLDPLYSCMGFSDGFKCSPVLNAKQKSYYEYIVVIVDTTLFTIQNFTGESRNSL